MTRVLDQVRDEVAEAYAPGACPLVPNRHQREGRADRPGGFREDLTRIRGQEGLPIEVLDSVRSRGQGRDDYLNAIVDYNWAELELYVALGAAAGQCPGPSRAGPAETIPPPIPEPPQIPVR